MLCSIDKVTTEYQISDWFAMTCYRHMTNLSIPKYCHYYIVVILTVSGLSRNVYRTSRA